MADDQDWTPVTLKKRVQQTNKSPQIQRSPQAAAINRLEKEDIGKLRSLSIESRNEMTQKRVALGKNQVQLNMDCRFPANTIREIESGRVCPNPSQLSLLNRVLRSSIKYQL